MPDHPDDAPGVDDSGRPSGASGSPDDGLPGWDPPEAESTSSTSSRDRPTDPSDRAAPDVEASRRGNWSSNTNWERYGDAQHHYPSFPLQVEITEEQLDEWFEQFDGPEGAEEYARFIESVPPEVWEDVWPYDFERLLRLEKRYVFLQYLGWVGGDEAPPRERAHAGPPDAMSSSTRPSKAPVIVGGTIGVVLLVALAGWLASRSGGADTDATVVVGSSESGSSAPEPAGEEPAAADADQVESASEPAEQPDQPTDQADETAQPAAESTETAVGEAVVPNGWDEVGDNGSSGRPPEPGGEGADITQFDEYAGSYVFEMTVAGDGRTMSTAATTKWYNPRFIVNNDPETNRYADESGFSVDVGWNDGVPEADVRDSNDGLVTDAVVDIEWIDASTLRVTVQPIGDAVVVDRARIELSVRTQDADGNTVATFEDDAFWDADS